MNNERAIPHRIDDTVLLSIALPYGRETELGNDTELVFTEDDIITICHTVMDACGLPKGK